MASSSSSSAPPTTLCVPAPMPASRSDFTLSSPLPLTPYAFDRTLSEDENFLTWATILTRHSVSRKGHMGTLFVRPPTSGDPRVPGACAPDPQTRLLVHANNTPILYASSPRMVPEIHAEALAISRAARAGLALQGCTVYVTFPPCNECAKLLLAVGVGRVVYRKCYTQGAKEGVLAAAGVLDVQMEGTADYLYRLPPPGETPEETQKRQDAWRASEREREDERERRVKAVWEAAGDDAASTRRRVNEWWEAWMGAHRKKVRELWRTWGGNGEEGEQKAREEERERRRNKENKRGGKGKGKGKPLEEQDDDEMDLDELRNETAPAQPASSTLASSSIPAASSSAAPAAPPAPAPAPPPAPASASALASASASAQAQAQAQAGVKRRSSDLSPPRAAAADDAHASHAAQAQAQGVPGEASQSHAAQQSQEQHEQDAQSQSPPRKVSRV